MEEMESYLAQELESKLKIEELQKDIIELKTSNVNLSALNKIANEKNELQKTNHAKETEKLEQSFHEEVNKNKLEKEEKKKLVLENKTLNLKLESLNILTDERIELQKLDHEKETKNLAQSFYDELKNASERSQTKIDKKELEVVELQKVNNELKTSILKLEQIKTLANQEIESQKIKHEKETENLKRYFHNELENAYEESQKRSDKQLENMRKRVEEELDNKNMQIEEKDLAIKNLVAREKELDENIAEKDAKIRSQAHEIGRRRADSFEKANHTCLSSIKKRKFQ